MRTAALVAVLGVGVGVVLAAQPPAPAVVVEFKAVLAAPAAPPVAVAAAPAGPAAPVIDPFGANAAVMGAAAALARPKADPEFAPNAAVGGAAAVVGGLAARPPAQAPPLPVDPAVLALVADLGATDYPTREKAGRALELRGERALPDLRRALPGVADPEAARRLAVMVKRLEHDRMVAPKRVTLAVKNKTAKEVFDEIARQTGYRIDAQGGGPGGAKYSFDLTDVPFWLAMDKVSEATGMGVYHNYGQEDDSITLNSGNGTGVSAYTSYPGPFKFSAQNLTSTRTMNLVGIGPGGTARQPEGLNLAFNIQSEPKLPILSVLQAELVSAIDDTGASMAPPKDPNNRDRFNHSYYSYNSYRQYIFSSNLNLARGGRDASRIKSVKGRLGVVLLSGTVPDVVVPDPLKTKNKKYTGRSVEIEYDNMTEANGVYTVTLTARKAGADENQQDYNWLYSAWQKVEVTDAAGNKYFGSQNGMNWNFPAVTITMQFSAQNNGGRFGRGGGGPAAGPAAKLGPPARVVFNEWLQVTHEVAFEFKDIPLP